MTLQKEFHHIQDIIGNIPGAVNVLFEAHYWGQFRLLTNGAEAFPDPEGFILLAQSQSPPYDTWLLLDLEKQKIVLREGDNKTTPLVGFSIEEFLGSREDFQKRLLQSPPPFVFDHRLPLAQLLSPDRFVITAIDDPEFFETIEGYYALLQIIAQLTEQDLLFTDIKGQQNGIKKSLQLTKGTKEWTIALNKELFDNDIIHGLNDILVELGVSDYVLSTSISEGMKMVVMKLNGEEFMTLKRMGLLI